MDRKTLLTVLAAVMMACAAFAVQATRPSDQTCAAEDADGDSIYCKSITLPGYKRVKTLPLSFNQRVAGPGSVAFDASEFSPGATRVTIWAELVGGASGCLPFSSLTQSCGFDMVVCNDRDLDSVCTNTLDKDDQLRGTQSNEPLVGENCGNEDKDDKDCPDDFDAQVDFCAKPALGGNSWSNGQMVVFIGTWIDAWPGVIGNDLNTGSGTSLGPYDVWLQDHGNCTSVPACDDGSDNDGDGRTDHPNDLECANPDDDDETGTPRLAGCDPAPDAGATYVAQTLVTRVDGNTLEDEGGAIFVPGGAGENVGGACIKADGGSVTVTDAVAAAADPVNNPLGLVPFQVCLDLDNNGLCIDSSASEDHAYPACNDIVRYSHKDGQASLVASLSFVLPPSSSADCAGFLNNYVVFVCTGVHRFGGPLVGPHVHPSGKGTITPGGGGGFGWKDTQQGFCGSPIITVKPYHQIWT